MFLLWEKMFQTYKQIIPRICKNLLSIKKTNKDNPIGKRAKNKNRPSQPEGKIGLPRANPRGRLRSPS